MKILRLSFVLLVIATAALAQSDVFEWGKTRSHVHEVSVAELLGRPEFFDGQPVRVLGVAQFSFEFESSSAIYLTKDDAEHSTQSRIDVWFGPEFSGPKDSIAALSARYVAVEGEFHMLRREHILGTEKGISVCIRQCPAAGYIDNINSIGSW
jgi:hypothetical protein